MILYLSFDITIVLDKIASNSTLINNPDCRDRKPGEKRRIIENQNQNRRPNRFLYISVLRKVEIIELKDVKYFNSKVIPLSTNVDNAIKYKREKREELEKYSSLLKILIC